jgi:signal transduction histidine kinase
LSKSYEGTGIGLSIVKKAAERMGGSVGLISEPGKGSLFWIELRAAQLVEPQASAPTSLVS